MFIIGFLRIPTCLGKGENAVPIFKMVRKHRLYLHLNIHTLSSPGCTESPRNSVKFVVKQNLTPKVIRFAPLVGPPCDLRHVNSTAWDTGYCLRQKRTPQAPSLGAQSPALAAAIIVWMVVKPWGGRAWLEDAGL